MTAKKLFLLAVYAGCYAVENNKSATKIFTVLHFFAEYDRLFKIRPVIDLIVPKFKQMYQPGKNLSLDEMTTPFKGRSIMKMYNKSKPSKWGYKVFVVSEATTGCCLEWKMYTGKHDEFQDEFLSKTHQLVMNSMTNYFGVGHIVYMDSFYNSPGLSLSLAANKVGVCGTVNVNRKEMPRQLKPRNTPLAKDDPPAYMKTGNLLVCAWHDTKRLHMLSTVHNAGCVEKSINDKKVPQGKRVIQKSFCTDEYNKCIGRC